MINENIIVPNPQDSTADRLIIEYPPKSYQSYTKLSSINCLKFRSI